MELVLGCGETKRRAASGWRGGIRVAGGFGADRDEREVVRGDQVKGRRRRCGRRCGWARAVVRGPLCLA